MLVLKELAASCLVHCLTEYGIHSCCIWFCVRAFALDDIAYEMRMWKLLEIKL